MKIKKFVASKVHGFLDYNISFDKRLTFLIGINGTGKTSVLKLILGLVSPSYNYLNSITYASIKLVCVDDDNKTFTIESAQLSESDYSLIVQRRGEKSVEGKVLKFSPRQFQYMMESEDHDEKLNLILDSFNEQEVVQSIKELTTPLFLGLDRRVYEGKQIDKMRQNFLYRRKYKHYPQNDPLNLGLIDIQEMLFDYVRIIASKQPQINQDFKNKILLQSFEFLESQDINIINDFRELHHKKELALNAFKNLNISGFKEQVNVFFERLDGVLREINNRRKREVISRKKQDIEIDPEEFEVIRQWFNNQPQLKRIDKLIEYNEAYQQEVEELYQPIEKLKNIINKFFRESKKELRIDPQGQLKVLFKNGKEADIFELSSGEKQIITMLGHLIFFEENFKMHQGIFIIDEPELSLHLAWQEIFVQAIMEASPNTQFILATHSPAITGDAPENLFQDLAKLN